MGEILSFPPPAREASPIVRQPIPENPIVLIDRWPEQGFSVGVVPYSTLSGIGYHIDARRFRVDGMYPAHHQASRAARLISVELGGIAIVDESGPALPPSPNGGAAA